MPVLGGRVLPALMLVAAAATANAQQKTCDIDESSPNQVARAKLDLSLAQGAGKPEDAANRLRDAVKLVNDGDMSKNPTGRAWMLGQTLVMWMGQPGMTGGMSTRGAVGFQTNPTAPYDLVAGIDSAFTIVETAMPDCVSQTTAWRQQKGWVDLVNHAIELVNGGKLDSAVFYAKRSLQLSKHSPYGFMVLAQVAAQNNQAKDAINDYKQAIAAAANDTAQADNRRGMENTLGGLAADAAETATGADKAEYIADAKEAYAALAKDPGTKYADAARAGQARIATLTGDTTAIKSSYADQLANPGAFSYNSLMQAAVVAAKANELPDAIKLFEAARAANPYHRDVLFNLARVYVLDSAYDKAVPLGKQLIAVDPGNPDNYELLSIAYAAIQKRYSDKAKMYDSTAKALGQRANTSKNARVVKAAIDSASRINRVITAYQDSTKTNVDSALAYKTMSDTLPERVTFSEFTPSDTKATLSGTVANNGSAAKTFTLKIEFLDRSGSVVTSQAVPVGPVQPKQSTDFKIDGAGAGIVAFRYTVQ